MSYNYQNLDKSVKRVQEEDAAKSGKLPEGVYTVSISSVEYGTEKSGIRTWIFHCTILSPGTIYHRAAREIRYSERKDYFAKERFQALIEMMNIWGVDLTWFDSPEGMLDVLSAVADTKMKMKIKVSDQVDKDGNVSEKYQDFNVETDSLNPVDWTEYKEANGLLSKAVAPKQAEQAEDEIEELAEEEVAPPVKPVSRSPFKTSK